MIFSIPKNCIGRILEISAIAIISTIPFHGAQATRLYFEPSSIEIKQNQETEVYLMLDTEGDTINALEGTVIFPQDFILKRVLAGGSLTTLWIERPKVKGSEVRFAGSVPGGFEGEYGPFWDGPRDGIVFSVLFEPQSEGEYKVTLGDDTQVLLHDGKGNPAGLSKDEFTVNVSGKVEKIGVPTIFDPDNNPPEIISMEVNQNEHLFNGDYFLVFYAQDKESGISHYEVRESKRKLTAQEQSDVWARAESPHRLEDQKLESYIYLKAMDVYGNGTVSFLPPQNPVAPFNRIVRAIITIIILVFVLFYITYRIFKKPKN